MVTWLLLDNKPQKGWPGDEDERCRRVCSLLELLPPNSPYFFCFVVSKSELEACHYSFTLQQLFSNFISIFQIHLYFFFKTQFSLQNLNDNNLNEGIVDIF